MIKKTSLFLPDPSNTGAFLHTCLLARKNGLLPEVVSSFLERIELTSSLDINHPPDSVLLTISGFKRGSLMDEMNKLPKPLLELIRRGKTSLTIDYSHENGSSEMLDETEEILKLLSDSNLCSLAIILQNRNIVSKDSRIKIFYFDSFILSACHEIIATVGGLSFQDLFAKLDNPYGILCLNATPRRHRILTLLLLSECGLACLDRSQANASTGTIISFPGLNYTKTEQENVSTIKKWLTTHGLERLESRLDSLLLNAPFLADHAQGKGNELANSIPVELYQKTILSVVTETSIDRYSRRITEKSFKAASLGHPFVIVGHAGSLEILRTMGFATYDHCINPLYDLEEEPVTRASMAVGSAKGFMDSINSGHFRAESIYEHRQFNFRWCQNGFLQSYHERFTIHIFGFLNNIHI